MAVNLLGVRWWNVHHTASNYGHDRTQTDDKYSSDTGDHRLAPAALFEGTWTTWQR